MTRMDTHGMTRMDVRNSQQQARPRPRQRLALVQHDVVAFPPSDLFVFARFVAFVPMDMIKNPTVGFLC
jgi:hypothetical protein